MIALDELIQDYLKEKNIWSWKKFMV
jgi:hypothetical protein